MKKKTLKTDVISQAKKLVIWSIVLGFSVVTICLSILTLYINNTVKEICTNAQEKYQKTCPQSLIKLLANQSESFHDKNDAIWTIGRMRSEEALPTLQKLYTGIIPDREPYDSVLSQYEIRKAILRIDENADVSFSPEKNIKEMLMDCMPKSDMGSKKICDDLIKSITSYKACAEAGFLIQESYPERCRLPDGRTFTNN